MFNKDLLLSGNKIFPHTHLLTVDGFLENARGLYLARSDTKLSLGLPSYGSEQSGQVTWDQKLLLTSEDIGKTIPIWLSNTPPVALNRCISINSSTYRSVA